MLNHGHVILTSLIIIITIIIKFCLADIDNLQDFCLAAVTTSNDVFINGFPCKDPANVTPSDFKTSKLKLAGDTHNLYRSSTNIVTAAQLPGLNTLGLALGRIDLAQDGVVSPHSHPRAAEIMFVSQGAVTLGFLDTSNRLFQKVLKEGDVFIVPKAMRHFCINMGSGPAIIFSAHNSQSPGLIGVPGSGVLFGSGSLDLEEVKNSLASFSQNEVDSQTEASSPHTE